MNIIILCFLYEVSFFLYTEERLAGESNCMHIYIYIVVVVFCVS